MARRHDVREREQRGHQLVVRPHRQHDQRAVRLRDANRFTLAAVDTVEAVPAPVEARGVQPLAAEDAGPVRPHERCEDEVAGFQRADLVARVLDDADELVAHAAAGLGGLHLVVGPEVASADRGAGDPDDGVGRLDEAGIRDGLDADVACAVHECRAHRASSLPESASRDGLYPVGPTRQSSVASRRWTMRSRRTMSSRWKAFGDVIASTVVTPRPAWPSAYRSTTLPSSLSKLKRIPTAPSPRSSLRLRTFVAATSCADVKFSANVSRALCVAAARALSESDAFAASSDSKEFTSFARERRGVRPTLLPCVQNERRNVIRGGVVLVSSPGLQVIPDGRSSGPSAIAARSGAPAGLTGSSGARPSDAAAYWGIGTGSPLEPPWRAIWICESRMPTSRSAR